jgi:sn-glycerol 3-phosphate transport system permease protein
LDAWNSAPFATYLNSRVHHLAIIGLQTNIMCLRPTLCQFEFLGKGILFSIVLIAFMMPVQITPAHYNLMSDMAWMNTMIPADPALMTNAFGHLPIAASTSSGARRVDRGRPSGQRTVKARSWRGS